MTREPEPQAPPPKRRFRRVAVWTLKGAGRLAWGAAKALGRLLLWSAKAGWRAGRRFERRRKERKREPPTE